MESCLAEGSPGEGQALQPCLDILHGFALAFKRCLWQSVRHFIVHPTVWRRLHHCKHPEVLLLQQRTTPLNLLLRSEQSNAKALDFL